MSLDPRGASLNGAEQSREIDIPRFLFLWFQLGLFLVLVHRFSIDSRAFLNVGIVSFFGFSIHYFLPLRLRLPFFLFLSLLSIEVVFGYQEKEWFLPGLVQGAWIIGIGLALVGLAHLPVRFSLRVALIAVAGIALAILRGSEMSLPWSASIWPLLGSMFMFRLIVYLYDLRHEKSEASLSTRLSYFFMLPNVCFPLFPVVDYQAFRRSYYDQADRHAIYQVGLKWMVRGVVHLLLYRLIYQNLVVDAAQVETAGDLLQYLLWPFLLYLRVSGYFHVIVGMLHLFGFNLAETHHLYYLASSYTDFWRRINIPWKDFMNDSAASEEPTAHEESESSEARFAEPENFEELEKELARTKAALESMGPVNVLAAQEYEDQEERYTFLAEQRADVMHSVKSLKATIREINETSLERFVATFEEVNERFGATFQQLFRGGEAMMRIMDEEDPLESGLEIVARPPGKRPQNINLLSGGEKALTAIALLFALFRTKPSPFCILDEVDAPLDDANVLRFVELLRDMTDETQFLVITHNKLTMEAASTLYGVTMEERGVSKIVGVEVDNLHPQPALAS